MSGNNYLQLDSDTERMTNVIRGNLILFCQIAEGAGSDRFCAKVGSGKEIAAKYGDYSGSFDPE